MNWPAILAQLHEHREAIALLILAFVVTMRPKLPWPFILIEPLEWVYEWSRDALLTFISMRGPHPPQNVDSAAQVVKVTEPSGKVTETVETAKHAETPPEKVP